MQRPSSMETFNGCLGNARRWRTATLHQPGHGLRRVRAEAAGAALRGGDGGGQRLGFDRALRAITWTPPSCLGSTTVSGASENGKVADLVLYDATRSSTPRT